MTAPHNDREFLSTLTIEPLAPHNWHLFEALFGEKGACGQCWCMNYRLVKADYERGKTGGGNKAAMHDLVRHHRPTGLLALHGGAAVAWCAFAPREDFVRLEASRVHKRIDDEAVWSIPCFYVDRRYRGRGLSVALLQGVIRYAREKGIKVLEAYPAMPTPQKLPDTFAWFGLYQSFERAGFRIVDRTSPNRPMVRYYTGEG